jgi:hypothetical protein
MIFTSLVKTVPGKILGERPRIVQEDVNETWSIGELVGLLKRRCKRLAREDETLVNVAQLLNTPFN